jgi:hypothetical protein
MQRHWADNAVSATFTFREDEHDEIEAVLRAFDGQLKSVSFLPIYDGGAYKQMPYEPISEDRYNEMIQDLKPINWKKLYKSGIEAEGDRFCTNDTCII